MIDLKAYKEWKEIFDENVANVWEEESIPVLKKLSMMLFCIKKEIKNIEAEVDRDVSDIRNTVTEAQNKQKLRAALKSSGSRNSNNNNNEKENTQFNRSKIEVLQPRNWSQNKTFDSPEMFQNVDVPLSGSNDSGSIIISDEDMPISRASVSPEIKRKKRNHDSHKRSWKEQKSRDSNTPTMTFFRELIGTRKDDSKLQENGEERERTNSIDNISSMDFLKYSDSPNKSLKQTESSGTKDKSEQKDDNNLRSKIETMVLTPVRNDCDIDLSIVQCTPVSILLPKRKDKTASYLSKKRIRKEKSGTLTQMFSTHKSKIAKEKKECRLQKPNSDSDENHCDPSSGTSSEAGSLMGITRMVSYLNTNSPLKERNDALKPEETPGLSKLDISAEEIADIVKDIGYEDFEDEEDEANNTLNSAIVGEENDNDITDITKGLNGFLAKAQNVPEHQLEVEPVVRGKERQKLPAWSCKDCEKFYLNQGLSANQILALNQKCSKHRGYFRPREDTLPGYWDMDMNTPTQ